MLVISIEYPCVDGHHLGFGICGKGQVETNLVDDTTSSPVVTASHELSTFSVDDVCNTVECEVASLLFNTISRERIQLRSTLVHTDNTGNGCLGRICKAFGQHFELVINLNLIVTVYCIELALFFGDGCTGNLHQHRDVVSSQCLGNGNSLGSGSSISNGEALCIGVGCLCEFGQCVIDIQFTNNGTVQHLTSLKCQTSVIEIQCAGSVLYIGIVARNGSYVSILQGYLSFRTLFKSLESSKVSGLGYRRTFTTFADGNLIDVATVGVDYGYVTVILNGPRVALKRHRCEGVANLSFTLHQLHATAISNLVRLNLHRNDRTRRHIRNDKRVILSTHPEI